MRKRNVNHVLQISIENLDSNLCLLTNIRVQKDRHKRKLHAYLDVEKS